MSFEQEVDDIEANTFLGGEPFFSRAGGKIFLIWLVFTTVGVLIGVFAPHHLLPSLLSPSGSDVWSTIVFFTVLAAPVAAFVYAVAFYSLVAWRYKGDPDEPPPDGAPQRGNGPVTVLWLSLSTFLVVVLLAWGITVLSAQQTSHPNTLQVDVTGQQWVWTYSYPGTGVETRTLELPVNRPVEFNVTSEDVTHGFWPAALGIQVDANPNVTTVIRTTPNRLGTFTVRCSQLCGLYHAFMYNDGDVVSPQQFAQWLQVHGATSTAADQVADATPSSASTTAAGAPTSVASS
ncbi:MAG: cytochrome c oxidase subunit II [Acidimicrobiales bacterium]|jgi:cytochrome c oxidase subunit 2